MFGELKVDIRRIPNRHGEVEEVVEEPQPEPVPEPVAIAPQPVAIEPEPVAPSPAPVVIVKPVVVEQPVVIVEEEVEAIEEPVAVAPELPALSEVEYRWDVVDLPTNGGDANDDERDEALYDEWLNPATRW
jgi:hypothetical protein